MSTKITTMKENLNEVRAALEEIENKLQVEDMPCDNTLPSNGCASCILHDPEHGCLQDLCSHIISNWGKY